jgi:hypothetical protein
MHALGGLGDDGSGEMGDGVVVPEHERVIRAREECKRGKEADPVQPETKIKSPWTTARE